MHAFFRVPFDDKAAAKALGARWSMDFELWYAATAEVEHALAARWPRIEPLPPLDTFPGEDRTFGAIPTLSVDLIPSTCWFTNIRSCVSKEDWKRIAMGVRRRAGKQCELCGGKDAPTEGVFLEPHERFDYVGGVQVLRRLVCACSRCHKAIHFGHAQATGQEAAAWERLATVNQWDDAQIKQHVRHAFDVWAARSRQDWTLDIGIIQAAGVVVRLPTPEQRQARGVNLNHVRTPGSDLDSFLGTLGLSGIL